MARISASQKPGQPELYTPDIKFNRNIGRWAGQKLHARSGERLEDKSYEEHVLEVMPQPSDRKLLLDILRNEKNWIAPKTGASDPLETIGAPRRQAINL